jgi:nitroreductase
MQNTEQINASQEALHHELTEEVRQHRQADHEIDPVFLNRWSPRAFSEEPVEEEVLLSVFEAARWAPSSNNEQPWRFVIARTPRDRERFLEFLAPANQVWAKHAPVLLVILAKRTFSHNGAPNKVHQFDAGCAWGYIALQALQNGLITHGMAGFDNDKAREILGVPEDFDVMAVVAIGKRGEKSELPEKLQEREVPSKRRPLAETMMEGGFRPEA